MRPTEQFVHVYRCAPKQSDIRRLRGLLNSSAFTPEQRANVLHYLDGQPNQYGVEKALRWALDKHRSAPPKAERPLGHRLASLCEKIAWRLAEFERDPSKPIRPI